MLADFQSIVENDTVPGYVMQQTDDYILYRTGDWQGSTEYLKMYGYFSDSSFFMMQSPLESIRESAALANRFLIYLGLTGIILRRSARLVFLKKDNETDYGTCGSVKEMANLNFDARYTRGGQRRNRHSRENFNKMSAQLEKTVSEL